MSIDWLAYLAAAASGYLLGSIPFGLVITKMAGLGDIRDIGSGNIGATNVLRTGRKDLAAATLVLDAGKAGLAFLLWFWFAGRHLFSDPAITDTMTRVTTELATPSNFVLGLVSGAFAFVGHCYPVWLKFKGGKGVATFIGLMLAAMWQVGLAFAATWLLVAAIFRMSSLAGLIGATLAPIYVWLFGYGPMAIITFGLLAVLMYWRHRSNIGRIASGKEPKIGEKKKGAAPPESAG
jgi:glycerol-3-phosphate acyltransferase PlsY